MYAIYTQEELNNIKQLEHNFNVLYTTIMNFRENIKFKCIENCEDCMFKNTSFDGKVCLAGFYLPGVEKEMLKEIPEKDVTTTSAE